MDVDNALSDVDVVHPELYSKCRLCILEVGQIRTLPAIQEKIKFCFDIMVMPNDYLPQLLCLKCSNILANYCDLKKKYLENQKILQFKLNPLKDFLEPKAAEYTVPDPTTSNVEIEPKRKEPCIISTKVTESLLQMKPTIKDVIEKEPENREASKPQKDSAKDRSGSGNSNSSNENKKNIHKNKGKRKRIRLQSDNDDDVFPTTKSKKNEISNRSWKSIYRKKIVCRFCNMSFQTKRSFNIHLGTHSDLIKTYDAVIKQHCIVTLNKVDCLPNITGSTKNVALLNDTIIREIGNSTFYHSFVIENANSSEDESLVIQGCHKRKRLRLEPNASSDIESKQSKKEQRNTESSKPPIEEDNNDIQCINIDDTSSDTFDSTTAAKTGKEYDLGVINSIVNTYYNKHKKDKKTKGEDNDVILCRKLLSTGRKIMSGHGTQAPGLVKYLEQKNLALSWYPFNTQIYQGMKTNYVRIITKIREKSENNLLFGWNIVKDNEDLIYDEETEHMSVEIILNPITSLEKDSLLTKLLNANPVANPKQLPKKNNPDTQSAIAATPRIPIAQVTNSDQIFIDLDDDNDNMLMPVIMSTESLASQSNAPEPVTETVSLKNKENNKNETNAYEICNSAKDRHVPRIKCKPVSELMPQISHNFNNIINSNVPLVVTQPVITINQPILTLTPQTNSVNQYTDSMTPILETSLLQSVNNMLHVANSTLPTINVISQPLNGISQQANPLVDPANATSGLSNAAIQMSDSVVTSNCAAPSVAGVVSQPVSTQQLPPWSRGSSQGAPVGPVVNANNALPKLKTEEVQSSTALTQSASTPVPPTPPPTADSKAAPIQAITPEAGIVIMNSVYLPNMPTSKPIRYFKNVLFMHDLILLIKPNTVLSEGFVCLVKFKLDVKQHSRKVILGLSLHTFKNQFCIKVRKPNNDEMEVESLAAFWQMEILKSFLGQVSEKIINSAMKISPLVHENAKQFVFLLKSIDCKLKDVTSEK